jgi:hypothetical protein
VAKKPDNAITLMQKLQDVENKKAFFDEFIRLEQKARLHGRFPDMANLIRLDHYLETFKETYGENSPSFKTIERLVDTSIKKNMEYSISIDGGGRQEFIKSTIQPKEDKEESEKEKGILDQLAEKLG